jgi:transcriptional regulator with XRE-family HTH domain
MNTLLGFPGSHTTNPFGRLLRQWRTTRHLSQLRLATEAGISTRHLSFLETGRAQPSREMVQLLTGMLDIPHGERNALLVSAGYAPTHGERPVGAPELEPVRRALQFILRQQEPFPAIVLDGGWNIVMRNEASTRIFGLFKEPDHDSHSSNVLRTIFDPRCLRAFIVNWEDVAHCVIQSVHRDVAANGRDDLLQLREEMLSYPGVPSRWAAPDAIGATPPLVTMHVRKGDLALAFFSTITTFATPRDHALQQLKIECFFPGDAVTEQVARRMAIPQPVAV